MKYAISADLGNCNRWSAPAFGTFHQLGVRKCPSWNHLSFSKAWDFLRIITLLFAGAGNIFAQSNALNSSGNAGIGTTTPSARLDIITPANASGRVRAFSSLHVQNDTIQIDQFGTAHPTRPQWNIISASNEGQGLGFVVDNQPAIDAGTSLKGLFIKPGGLVGFGTINPTARLYVNSGEDALACVLATLPEGPAELRVRSHSSSTIFEKSFSILHSFYGDQRNGSINFHRGMSGEGGFLSFSSWGKERMRIDPEGKVCIGTQTAFATLDVEGRVNFGTGTLENRFLTPDTQVQVLTDTNVATQVTLWQRAVALSHFGHKASDSRFYITNGFDSSPLGTPARSLVLDASGNVGIGTATPTHKLSVSGSIRAQELIIESTGWSDYVFEKGYPLPSLAETEEHISRHGHLPGIPSAADVAANGVSVGEMQAKLLAKLEEMTLHQIAMEKRMRAIEEENTALRIELSELRAQ